MDAPLLCCELGCEAVTLFDYRAHVQSSHPPVLHYILAIYNGILALLRATEDNRGHWIVQSTS
jgi:hypothetical protein